MFTYKNLPKRGVMKRCIHYYLDLEVMVSNVNDENIGG